MAACTSQSATTFGTDGVGAKSRTLQDDAVFGIDSIASQLHMLVDRLVQKHQDALAKSEEAILAAVSRGTLVSATANSPPNLLNICNRRISALPSPLDDRPLDVDNERILSTSASPGHSRKVPTKVSDDEVELSPRASPPSSPKTPQAPPYQSHYTAGTETLEAERTTSRLSVRRNSISAGEFEVCDLWVHGLQSLETGLERDETSSLRGDSRNLFSLKSASHASFINWQATKLKQAQSAYPDALHRSFVLQPHSWRKLFWDFFGIFLMAVDVAIVPMQALTAVELEYSDIFEWISRLFWTLDMPMTMFTGYFRADGDVETNLKLVVKHYAKSWFPFDAMLVSFNWGELAAAAWDGGVSTMKLGRIAKVIRFIRIFRLIRLAKLPRILEAVSERILSETVILLLGIVQGTFLILSLSHVIACTWLGLGHQDNSPNWIESYDHQNSAFEFQYLVAAQWGLSQFTESVANVTCKNQWEYIYSIFVQMAGYLCSAAFLASVTTSMTRLQIIGTEQQLQFSKLRQFLRYHRVNTKLSILCARSAKQALALQQKNVMEKDVELLSVLSSHLREQLHFEVHGHFFWVQPMIRKYMVYASKAMYQICHTACNVSLLSTRDVVFSQGERRNHPEMFILMHGLLKYKQDNPARPLQEVTNYQWVCEMVLWCRAWIQRGTLQAGTECTVLGLRAEQFQLILSGYVEELPGRYHPSRYAIAYVAELNLLDNKTLSDLDEGLCQRSRNRMTGPVSEGS